MAEGVSRSSATSSSRSGTVDIDVAIIGAGVSGLTAAYCIQAKDPGIRVAIIEAKGRVGGRTLGQVLNAASGKDTWDLGGQWVGSCQRDVIELIKELGLSLYEQYTCGAKLMQLSDDGRVSRYVSDIPALPLLSLLDLHFFMRKIEKMRQKIDISNPNLCDCASEWDVMSLEQFKQANLWTSAARRSLDAALRCMFGAEASQLSLLYFLTYLASAGGLDPLLSCRKDFGGQEFKVVGGAWQICTCLAEKIGLEKIHFDTPVNAIHQDGKSEKVFIQTSTGQTFHCKQVIMAIPPHQLVKLEYRPPLPAVKRHVWQRMPAGHITKVIVTYKRAFWRTAGLSGEAVTCSSIPIISGCDAGPLCIVFDATTPNGNAAIVSFIGGDQHLQYANLTPEDRKRAVLHSFSELFGSEALNPIDYCEKNWSDEPYCGGGPVSVGSPGSIIHATVALRQPFDRIHFAGTETATAWCGFLNGAVQSGRRAAMEVLYNIRPQIVTAHDLEGTVYDARAHRKKYPKHQPRRSRALHVSLIIGIIACVAVVLVRR